MTIFEHKTYKTYLSAVIRERSAEVRGFQRKLAEAAGCQPSYLSQALNGKVQLTPDHAHAISEFLSHSRAEAEFFMALVTLDRAATRGFRRHLQVRIDQLRAEHFRLTERIQAAAEPARADEFAATYYSTWSYVAIHVACTIPGLRTERALSEKLALPLAQVRAALETLEAQGFVARAGQEWQSTRKNIHIADNHPMISRHHFNWRFQAANHSHLTGASEIHYTGVYSISRADQLKIKQLLNEAILRAREIAKPSAEEELVNLNVDFYAV